MSCQSHTNETCTAPFLHSCRMPPESSSGITHHMPLLNSTWISCFRVLAISHTSLAEFASPEASAVALMTMRSTCSVAAVSPSVGSAATLACSWTQATSNLGCQAIDSWSRSRYLSLGTLATSNLGFQAIDSWSSSRYLSLGTLATSNPGF